MDKFDSKVVSFERNAEYLRQRALKNRREGKLVDALELMRQAWQRAPENTAYTMELADMYSEMGLYEQANRLLMRAMPRGEATNECLYLMANNLYNRGEISRAERVLRAYMESGAEGERAAEAKRLLDEIVYAKDFARPRDRKLLRAMRLVNRGCNALRGGEPVLAEKLFTESIRLRDVNAEVHALRALCMFLSGRALEAKNELEDTLNTVELQAPDRTNIKARCICAQVWNYLGQNETAQEILRGVMNLEADEAEAMMRVNALCEMGMHAEAYEAAQTALKNDPYDKTLLHICSAAAYLGGMDEEDILRGWQRIARLDPDDLICAYYIEAAKKGELSKDPPNYAYLLPREEMRRLTYFITDRVRGGDEAMKDAWQNDAEFRKILEWELVQGDPQLARASLTVLAGIQDEEARSLVRVYAERPDAPLDVRMFAMTMMRVQGIRPDPALTDSFLSAGMPSEEEIMSEMSVGEKQMIRYAAEYVEDEEGDYPVADIALIWRAFTEARGSAPDPVCRSEAGSAALAMVYMQMRGKNNDIYSISRWYGCSPRQAAHIARRLRDVIGATSTGE